MHFALLLTGTDFTDEPAQKLDVGNLKK